MFSFSLPVPPLFKVRHQELIPFLAPCCTLPQSIHSSIVEEWTLKEQTTSVDKERIHFIMDWWTAFYDFGHKRQHTSTPGQILVELKAQADAKAATKKDADEVAPNAKNGGVKRPKRNKQTGQKSALSDEEVKERARVTLDALGMKKRDDSPNERDQLDTTLPKRLRGGGGDPVIEDPRYSFMQEQVGELQSMVLQLLDAKV